MGGCTPRRSWSAGCGSLAVRHLAGEPVAYLIGEWEFYGLPLDISKEVLIPRPDTEVLADQALPYVQSLGKCRVLDLCAGSGCIGSGAGHPGSSGPGGAGRVLRRGPADLPAEHPPQRPDRPGGAHDWRTPWSGRTKALGEFQCIVSNPPYIPRWGYCRDWIIP